MKLLLESGANYEIKNQRGLSPLDLALKAKHEKIIALIKAKIPAKSIDTTYRDIPKDKQEINTQSNFWIKILVVTVVIALVLISGFLLKRFIKR